MQKKYKIVIAVVLFVAALALGGVYAQQYLADHKEQFAREKLNDNFQEYLSKFLKDVHEGMTEYKKERKVLVEATGSGNLGTPEYVEENYQLVQMLIPSLRQRMTKVIRIIENAETGINRLLEGQPETVRADVLEQWTDLKRTQGQIYIAYFAAENDILTAYEDLMRFYYTKRNDFTVVPETRAMVFKDPKDDEEAKQLQRRIADLYAQQDELLSKDSAKQP